MESQLAIDPDPDPEPPSYKIHQEKRGKYTVWVITQNNKLITVLSHRNLALAWVSRRQNAQSRTQLLTFKDK